MRNLNRISAQANRDAAIQDLNRATQKAFKHGISKSVVEKICAPLINSMKKELSKVSADVIDRYTSMVRHLWGAGYRPAYLVGQCRSGIDAAGTVVHAVPTYVDDLNHDDWICTWGTALCGARPGKRSNGFSDEPYKHQGLEVVTCPKCLKKLQGLETA